MKIKYFLRGFGTGILFATIILTISFALRNDNKAEEETTKSSVEELLEETSSQETKEETTIQETSSEETTVQETTIPETTVVETTAQIQTLNVTSGMTSTSVANMLESMGVIQDAKDFDNYLVTNGFSRNIVVGTFELNSNASYEEIADIITR